MTDTASIRVASRRFPHFPTRMVRDYGLFAAMVAGGAIITMLLIEICVSFFRPIEYSGWDLAQQLPLWFALGIGAHVGYTEFRAYVCHGQTRRNFMGEAALFALVFPLILALLYAIGFWIEAPLYMLMGWPQAVHNPIIYHHVFDVVTVVLECWLIFGVWTSAGLLLGAAFHRSATIGVLAIGLAMFAAQIVSISLGTDTGPIGAIFNNDVEPAETNVLVAVVAHLLCSAGMLVAMWFAIRDVAIHAK